MAYCRIVAFVIVEERDVPEVTEALLSVVDSFVVKNIAVFDSDVSFISNVEVPNAEEVRREIRADSTKT